jgi:hypothetical protein
MKFVLFKHAQFQRLTDGVVQSDRVFSEARSAHQKMCKQSLFYLITCRFVFNYKQRYEIREMKRLDTSVLLAHDIPDCSDCCPLT